MEQEGDEDHTTAMMQVHELLEVLQKDDEQGPQTNHKAPNAVDLVLQSVAVEEVFADPCFTV